MDSQNAARSQAAKNKINSLLFDAVIRGSASEVSLRLSQGGDPTLFVNTKALALDPSRFTKRHDSKNALMIAASQGHADIVSLLIPLCDVAAVDVSGRTAMVIAGEHGHPNCLALLIPPSPPFLDYMQRDALMIVCGSHKARSTAGHLACIDLLIPLTDFSRVDGRGNCALNLAMRSRGQGRVAAILPFSDPLRVNSRGLNVLLTSLHWQTLTAENILTLLSSIPVADFSSVDGLGRDALFLAAAIGISGPAIEILLRNPVPRSYMPTMTPLMAAAANGQLATTMQLATAISPRLVDVHGCDALMLAIENGKISTALFLAPLSDLSLLDIFGLSARDKAMAKPSDKGASIVEAIDKLLAVSDERLALEAHLPTPARRPPSARRM